jgi:phosphatidate cytidylyltransferase
MSLLIIVTGTLGALVMASVKRSLGAKRLDTSYVLTRGALDKMEMLFFAAPVFYHATVFFFMSDF